MTVTICDAFPDYPVADFPAEIPETWQNMSWQHDVMPFFVVPEKHLGVWMDYKDLAMRENGPEWPRFSVVRLDEEDCHTDDDFLLTTNEFSEVLAFVESFNAPDPQKDLQGLRLSAGHL